MPHQTHADTETGGEMGTIGARKQVLKAAVVHGGLRRGLHEGAKALDRGAARLCILAKDCNNDEYTKLGRALCAEGNIHLIRADEGKELGEWVGLAKLAEDGTVRKAVRCSVAVITDYGQETPALHAVLSYVKSQQ